MDRIIGTFEEGHFGPLVFVIGAIHGNEKAGLKALDLLLKMLEVEHITNTDFVFHGKLIAMRGNLEAIACDQRYIDKDLNRQFRKSEIASWKTKSILQSEERQAVEIVDFIHQQIDAYQPSKVFILDLHTTTASGGIFTIVPDDPATIALGLELHAPVIEGFLDGIQGTVLHYFKTENLGCSTQTLCFEAGQHEDKFSVNRAIAATVNFLSAIGCVEKFHIETQHNRILNQYAKGLPSHCSLMHCHGLKPNDGFKMKPGFQNFDPITKGQLLAKDDTGPILAPYNCRILMPHYQTQGEDGYFLIKDLSNQKIE